MQQKGKKKKDPVQDAFERIPFTQLPDVCLHKVSFHLIIEGILTTQNDPKETKCPQKIQKETKKYRQRDRMTTKAHKLITERPEKDIKSLQHDNE